MSEEQKKYREIPFRQGGTYSFRRAQSEAEQQDPATLEHVATRGLEEHRHASCLGVYFMINDSRFFAASIDARIELGGSILFDQRTDGPQKEELKRCVWKALDEESTSMGWQADHPGFGKSLITVCAWPYDNESAALYRTFDDLNNPPDNVKPGLVVARAIREWVHDKLRAQDPLRTSEMEQRAMRLRAQGLNMKGDGLIVKHGGDGTNLINQADDFKENVRETGGKSWEWVWHKKVANPRWEGRVQV